MSKLLIFATSTISLALVFYTIGVWSERNAKNLFHVLWATIVLIKKDVIKKKIFHKFSLFVWMIWLVPYLLGMANGIKQ